MRFEEHCRESLEKCGAAFEEVHRWLDALAGTPEYGMRHRCKRHHLAGIREVERLFGKAAAGAARLHIIADLREEGWTESDPFPRDETHYRKMGLF